MIFTGEERRTMPAPVDPARRPGDGDAPGRPEVTRPDTSDLLKRMKRVDPDAARRYRQRSGQ